MSQLKKTICSFIIFFIITSCLNIIFINSSSIRIVSSIKRVIITTSLGDCELEPCGTSGFCASPTNATCVEVNDTFECQCAKGFTTSEEDSLYQCCYKQKSSFTAFLLEVFIGFGAGHFYVGNYVMGGIKMGIYLVLFISTIIICTNRLRFKREEVENSFLLRIFRTVCFLLCGCTYVGWQMIDSVLFSLGGYTDSNNMELY